nr:MAG TPA: hypothetical protein [Caudoviricetes sp.]
MSGAHKFICGTSHFSHFRHKVFFDYTFQHFFSLLIFTCLQSPRTRVYRDYKIGNLGNLGTYNSIT